MSRIEMLSRVAPEVAAPAMDRDLPAPRQQLIDRDDARSDGPNAPHPQGMDRDGEALPEFTPLTFTFSAFGPGEGEAIVAGKFCSDKAGLWFRVPVPANATEGQSFTIEAPERYLSEKPLEFKMTDSIKTVDEQGQQMTNEQGQQMAYVQDGILCGKQYYKVPLPADWGMGHTISIHEPKQYLVEPQVVATVILKQSNISTDAQGQRTFLFEQKAKDGSQSKFYKFPLPADYEAGKRFSFVFQDPARFAYDPPLVFKMTEKIKIWTDADHPPGMALPGQQTVHINGGKNRGGAMFKVMPIFASAPAFFAAARR